MKRKYAPPEVRTRCAHDTQANCPQCREPVELVERRDDVPDAVDTAVEPGVVPQDALARNERAVMHDRILARINSREKT